jgi:hypothetical protein
MLSYSDVLRVSSAVFAIIIAFGLISWVFPRLMPETNIINIMTAISIVAAIIELFKLKTGASPQELIEILRGQQLHQATMKAKETPTDTYEQVFKSIKDLQRALEDYLEAEK